MLDTHCLTRALIGFWLYHARQGRVSIARRCINICKDILLNSVLVVKDNIIFVIAPANHTFVQSHVLHS